ncbi:hypothetical protein ABW21_db0208179 [Orbilia brochopaga]|nr:hypothetical protein ABW21_db0208179 [Drechslerella brochopaga]
MTPTNYAILSLPPSLPSTHPSYQTTLKRAYHRTLLRCHPDKLPAGADGVSTTTHHDANTEIYTIDQINTAYKTLSSPSLRHAYDLSLRQLQSSSGQPKVDAYRAGGLDIIDLDDMAYREDEGIDETIAAATCGRFTHSCRCGAEEGYVLTEDEMDEVETEVQRQRAADPSTASTARGRSMIVGCLGCSLYVQVDWAVCDDESE